METADLIVRYVLPYVIESNLNVRIVEAILGNRSIILLEPLSTDTRHLRNTSMILSERTESLGDGADE
jgi:hypothetical protein